MDDDRNGQFLPFPMIHEQAPIQIVKISLVNILVKNEKDKAQDQPKKYLIRTMHSQIHPRNGHHHTHYKQENCPESVLTIPDAVGNNGLIKHHHGKTVSAWVAEILRAKPLPFFYLIVDPYWSRLLEGLLKQRQHIVGQQKVRQMNNQQQFSVHHNVVNHHDSTYPDGVAHEGEQILDYMQEVIRLHFLVLVDEVDTKDEQWSLKDRIDGDDKTEYQVAYEKQVGCELFGGGIIFLMMVCQPRVRVRLG